MTLDRAHLAELVEDPNVPFCPEHHAMTRIAVEGGHEKLAVTCAGRELGTLNIGWSGHDPSQEISYFVKSVTARHNEEVAREIIGELLGTIDQCEKVLDRVRSPVRGQGWERDVKMLLAALRNANPQAEVES